MGSMMTKAKTGSEVGAPNDTSPLLERRDCAQKSHAPHSIFFQHVPFELSLTLSPMSKLSLYQKIPFKMILHILVMVFALAATLTRNTEYAHFSSSTTTTLRILLGVVDYADSLG